MNAHTLVRIILSAVIILLLSVAVIAKGPQNATGPVQAFSDTSITVKDLAFTITPKTVCTGGTNSDLAVGIQVQVKGTSEGGSLLAKEIKFFKTNKNGKSKVTAKGEITEVADSTITVGGVSFTIVASTKIRGGSQSDLTVGVEVVVQATKLEDGTYEAKSIKIIKERNRNKFSLRRKMTGVVTDITRDAADNVTQVTLDDATTFDVTAGLDLLGRHGLKASVNDLIEELKVRILYQPYQEETDSDTIGLAEWMMILGRRNIKGSIETVAAPDVDLFSIIVNSKTIYYDDVTVVIGANKGVDDPGDLTEGTPLSVLCNPMDDGSFLSNKVIVVGATGNKGGAFMDIGVVAAVVSDATGITSFTIDSTNYLVNGDTEFKIEGYDGPFPTELFDTGLEVVVKAQKDADGNLVALWVRVILPIYRYCGEITAITTSSFTLLGLTFNVTEYTNFEGFDTETTLADLTVGDKVEVKALLWPDDTLIASNVQPCDCDEECVYGEIESATGTADGVSLEVGGVTVNVTADTRIFKGKTTLSPSDLKVGLIIRAIGEYDASGILQADQIRVR